jgi:hypothetical protein
VASGVSSLTKRHGRVVDANGAPVPGALVVIVASTTPMPEIALVGDAEGKFVLWLPPGRFTLRAHSPEGTIGDADVEGAPSVEEIVVVVGR